MTVSVTDAIAAIQRPGPQSAPRAGSREALLVGNIGDLGEKLLNHLLSNTTYSHVRVAARSALRSAHAKLIVQAVGKVDGEDASAWSLPPVQDVLCCISGRGNYHKRDQAYVPVRAEDVVAIARAAQAAGVQRFLLVSPMSAWQQLSAAEASAFGEVEIALAQERLPSTVILRPSRDEDANADASLMQRFANGWLSVVKGYLTPQSFQHLRSDVIAKAAVHFLAHAEPGLTVLSARDIHAWAHPDAGLRRSI